LIRTSLAKSGNATPSSHLLTLIAVVVVIAGLYFGRQVLIPLSLAVVLAFLFSPLVDLLQRFRFGRVPAVLIVLLLAFSLLGSIGWVVAGQLVDIVDQIPSYKSNIHEKIQSLRVPNNSRLKSATSTVSELQAELSAASQLEQGKKTAATLHGRPVAVQVSQPPSNAPEYLRAIVGPLTGVLEMSAMVIVFMLFILIKREDLRNRLIRLAGQDQLTVVTQALDDASQRLSRYLLFQFVVNTTYGVMFGIGVYLLRIPHPLLWGVLSGLLRFVPYIGTPIAAAFPIAMALAVFPGWHQAIFVFSIFVGLELITANLVEPWLYGAHTGISSLAILVAAVFWATLWGPVGLILSTPLAVCLILMGRYVPQLGFLEVLLGDEAVLPVEAHFYQRLLAFDENEARDIAEAYLKEKPIGSFYDSVLIPSLALAEQDRHVDSLEARTASFVTQSARELIDELGERNSVGQGAEELVLFHREKSDGQEPKYDALRGVTIVCIPAGDEADELVAMMAEQLLQRLGCEVQRLPIASSANVIDPIATYSPQVAFVSALPPFASWQARALCKLLRRRHPKMSILLGLWHFEGGIAKAQDRVGLGCADMVATSLEQAILQLAESQGSSTENRPIHVERANGSESGDDLVEGLANREI
jgi:predicted PurR-regulated permease PerM